MSGNSILLLSSIARETVFNLSVVRSTAHNLSVNMSLQGSSSEEQIRSAAACLGDTSGRRQGMRDKR
eukprot:6471678-Amphidinium_carterae.1